MSNIPDDVAAKAAKADELLLAEEARRQSGEPDVPVKEPAEKPIEKPVEKPVEKKVEKPVESVKTLTPKVEKPSSPVEKDLEALRTELKNEAHKREIDQGRYRKDMEELQDQLEARNEVIAELNAKDGTDDIRESFTDKEREDLGEPYIDGIAKAVNLALEKERAVNKVKNDALVAAIDGLKNTTHTDSKAMYENQVFAKLGMTIAQMQEIDRSQEFFDFCQNPDGFSGVTIGQSLDNAVIAHNVDGTTGIYEAFKATLKAGGTPPAQFPERSAAVESNLETEITSNAPMSHEDIATAFAKNEISHVKMEELTLLADQDIEKKFQANR